jgi:hypothetical protein
VLGSCGYFFFLCCIQRLCGHGRKTPRSPSLGSSQGCGHLTNDRSFSVLSSMRSYCGSITSTRVISDTPVISDARVIFYEPCRIIPLLKGFSVPKSVPPPPPNRVFRNLKLYVGWCLSSFSWVYLPVQQPIFPHMTLHPTCFGRFCCIYQGLAALKCELSDHILGRSSLQD